MGGWIGEQHRDKNMQQQQTSTHKFNSTVKQATVGLSLCAALLMLQQPQHSSRQQSVQFYNYQSVRNKINSMSNHSALHNRSTHKHPTISSNTHYAYPFTTTPRFHHPHPYCPQAFYSYHSQLSTRKASLGSGKKTDFQKLLPNNPPSNRYNIKSIFETHNKRGISFGCSRDQSPDRSYLVPQIHRHPGPANYQNQVNTRMKQQYSLRSKTIDVFQKSKTTNFTPGPGAYESVDFQSNGGRTRVSKYSDSKLATIDAHTQRFPQIKNSPGPGEYHNDGGYIAVGKYTLSQHAGKGGRVFSRQARFTGELWRGSDTPSPAQYELPTEFKH